MRVLIATVRSPFVVGGGDLLAEGLRDAIAAAGHEVDLVTTPFRFAPLADVASTARTWAGWDLERYDAGTVDRVIHLKFPCYLAMHPDARVWLLHQHRPLYEHWNGGDADARRLRDELIKADTAALARVPHRYTISRRVTERLLACNGIDSIPLYHPPPLLGRHYCAPAEPYVLFPSRLERLKRQDLLIRAMAHVSSPVVAVIAGCGGWYDELAALVDALGLGHRVRLIGAVDPSTLLTLYARSLAVFFGPLDEDYGYVTLEAMLSAKPVVTCRDSGGPLEFVVDGETGLVVEPQPLAVAAALDALASQPARAAAMGRAGLTHYQAHSISWDAVVQALVRP